MERVSGLIDPPISGNTGSMSSILDRIRPFERAISSAVLFLVGLAAAGDIWSDSQSNSSFSHLLLEGFLAAASLIGAALLSLGFRQARTKAVQLQADITRIGEDSRRWKAESLRLIEGLSKMIDDQLDRWRLTPAEKEVALLILKGLSHKEIGEIRNTSEASARQQAYACYQKAGLSGRTELSAFFLEDLLNPESMKNHLR